MVSFDDYCKNPGQYKNSIPQSLQDYYNPLCETQKQLSTSSENDFGKELKDSLKEEGEFALKLAENFLKGVFSPQGIEMLSAFQGVFLGAPFALNTIANVIDKGLPATLWKTGSKELGIKGIEDMAAESGAELASTAAIATLASKAVIETTAKTVLVSSLKMVADAIPIVGEVLMVIQMLSFVLDTWDPAGYNETLNNENMQKYINGLNAAFYNNFLSLSYGSVDEFGNQIINTQWPLEFEITNNPLYFQEKYQGRDDQEWLLQYQYEYLLKLKVNSNGQPIVWPETSAKVITPYQLKGSSLILFKMFSNDNVVVANWFYRYGVIVIAVLMLILLILLFLSLH